MKGHSKEELLKLRGSNMPEEKRSKLQSSRSPGNTKTKRKKRKRVPASITGPDDTVKPQTAPLPPETSRGSLLPPACPSLSQGQLSKLGGPSKKDRDQLASSGCRSKKKPKNSPALLTGDQASGGVTQGCVSELSAPARDSLRWEGVLEDPHAEEKRLELYRANRRQRYMEHREALLKETQDIVRPTFS